MAGVGLPLGTDALGVSIEMMGGKINTGFSEVDLAGLEVVGVVCIGAEKTGTEMIRRACTIHRERWLD